MSEWLHDANGGRNDISKAETSGIDKVDWTTSSSNTVKAGESGGDGSLLIVGIGGGGLSSLREKKREAARVSYDGFSHNS